MTNPPDQPDLPEADPRNPHDLILIGGPHHNQTLRRSDISALFHHPDQPLLLSANPDSSPSAPFFAEYTATDHRHPFTNLRIYKFLGIGIDGSSIKAGSVNPNPPHPIHTPKKKKDS